MQLHMGVNHLGHFLLTSLLLPSMSKRGRIINHSSLMHLLANDDWFSESSYSPSYAHSRLQPYTRSRTDIAFISIQSSAGCASRNSSRSAYGSSKLAQLMFTYEINQRLMRAGNPNRLISVAVHPGYSATNILSGKLSVVEMGNAMLAMDGKSGALSQLLGTPVRCLGRIGGRERVSK